MSLTDDSCCVSLFDFIPETQQAAIRARTSTADMTTAIQSAIDHVAAAGGGCLCLPAGTYRVNSAIKLKKNVTLEGAGQRGSILQHTGTGNCLESVWDLNSVTPVDIRVRSLGIVNTLGGNNTGAAIYEQGGTYVAFEDLLIEHFKYGIVLNQSELVDIDLCTIQLQSLAAIWLVNGHDITPDANFSYTNRISVTRCQLNVVSNGLTPAEGYCILDDGGYSHAFRDNNYNGSVTHIRAAGVAGLLISGGEFEGAGNVNLHLTNTRRSGGGPGGGGVGSCGAVLVENATIVPHVGRPAIQIDNCIHLSLVGNGFGDAGDTQPLIVGVFNVFQLTELGTATASKILFDHPGSAQTRLYSTTAGLFGSAAYDPPSLARGASDSIKTMALAGVKVGDAVEDVSFSADSKGVMFHAWVSQDNEVSYFAHNLGGADPENLPSGTLRVKVRRRVF